MFVRNVKIWVIALLWDKATYYEAKDMSVPKLRPLYITKVQELNRLMTKATQLL